MICCRTLKSSKCDSKLTLADELCKTEVMKFFLSFPGRSSLSKQQRHHKTYRISLLRKFLIQNSQIKQFGKKISPKCNGSSRSAYYTKLPASRFVCQHVVWLGTQPLEKKKKHKTLVQIIRLNCSGIYSPPLYWFCSVGITCGNSRSNLPKPRKVVYVY